jgi:hypothetical protein
MKFNNKKIIATTVVILIFVLSMVLMERYRYQYSIEFLQAHQYTKEINNRIYSLEMLYAPFMIVLPVIAVIMGRDIFKFLFSEYMNGKKYKVILVLLVQISVFSFYPKCVQMLLRAGEMLYRTGNIVMPAYELALPYIFMVAAFIIAKIIMKTIIKDYEIGVLKNSNYSQHLNYMKTLEVFNEEKRNKKCDG